MDKIHNDDLLEFEKMMVENFVFRNAEKLIEKNPLDILLKYVEWRHNRYTVIDGGMAYLVMDIFESDEPVGIFDKARDPDAFNHAWDMCESMNDLPDNYVSIDGKIYQKSAQTTLKDDDSLLVDEEKD